MYLEHQPCRALAPYVECYWSRLQMPGAAEAGYAVLPDGCLDILFAQDEGGQSWAWVVGAMSRPLIVGPSACSLRYLGVRFRPGQAARFLGMPAAELTDDRVDLSDVRPGDDRTMAEQTLEAPSLAAGLRRLEAYLLGRLDEAKAAGDIYVDAVVRRIMERQGNVSVEALSAYAGISRQHLARRFQAHVGLSPKAFARVMRFRATAAALESLGPAGLAATAAALGYYDQAHLCRDFKAFSGLSPERFHLSKTSPEAPG